jgi:hypothetical protein
VAEIVRKPILNWTLQGLPMGLWREPRSPSIYALHVCPKSLRFRRAIYVPERPTEGGSARESCNARNNISGAGVKYYGLPG